jgi:hypothetical protein
MDYIDKYDELVRILTEDIEIDGKNVNLRDDFEKFFVKGNFTAGTRIRKVMQLLRKSAEEIRADVQEYKKSIK